MNWRSLWRDVASGNVRELWRRVRGRWMELTEPRLLPLRIRRQLRRAGRIERTLGAFDATRVPIVINCFNRVHSLRAMLAWLESAGHRNIILLDNDSTYPPLLEFYATTRHRVVKLGRNLGPCALWRSAFFREIAGGFYVYSDPDIIPSEQCPLDAVARLHSILMRHPERGKVGFGLRIDDLPAHYSRAKEVVEWESAFWRKEVEPGVYEASIDTTFALYRPGTQGPHWLPALRTGSPLVARHAPWYANSADPDPEELWYRRFMQGDASHWLTGRVITRA